MKQMPGEILRYNSGHPNILLIVGACFYLDHTIFAHLPIGSQFMVTSQHPDRNDINGIYCIICHDIISSHGNVVDHIIGLVV